VEHLATQPGWACGVCGEEWPCAPAKIQLSEEYADNEGALLVYLGKCMWDAFRDGQCPPHESNLPYPPTLRIRFIDWVVLPLIGRGGSKERTLSAA
jgi:hypothetical protein